MKTSLKHTILLFIVILSIVVTTFSVSVLYYEYSVQRVQFSLTDQNQRTITNKDLVGRSLIVFFGYTSCPDICPTQLFKLDQAIKKLDEEGQSNSIVPIFISVDPERDTHTQMKSYLTYFHSSFVGLTGSRAQLKKVTDGFNTLLPEAPISKNEDYLVAHSSLFYVVDEFGRVIDNISFNADANEIFENIKKHI